MKRAVEWFHRRKHETTSAVFAQHRPMMCAMTLMWPTTRSLPRLGSHEPNLSSYHYAYLGTRLHSNVVLALDHSFYSSHFVV